jgi:hypothetical protein
MNLARLHKEDLVRLNCMAVKINLVPAAAVEYDDKVIEAMAVWKRDEGSQSPFQPIDTNATCCSMYGSKLVHLVTFF